jgi:hypothetical protein
MVEVAIYAVRPTISKIIAHELYIIAMAGAAATAAASIRRSCDGSSCSLW